MRLECVCHGLADPEPVDSQALPLQSNTRGNIRLICRAQLCAVILPEEVTPSPWCFCTDLVESDATKQLFF